jgi:hypothetical protein
MSWADHGTASDERRGGCERASARSRLWIGSSTPPQTGHVRLKLWQASTHLGDGPPGTQTGSVEPYRLAVAGWGHLGSVTTSSRPMRRGHLMRSWRPVCSTTSNGPMESNGSLAPNQVFSVMLVM